MRKDRVLAGALAAVTAFSMTACGGGQAGGDRDRGHIHTGGRPDAGVDENNVGHGEESRQASNNFRHYCCCVLFKFKKLLQDSSLQKIL